jgi:predicted phosphodiesterase
VVPRISKEDVLEVIGKYRLEGEEPSIMNIATDLGINPSIVGEAIGEYGITFDYDDLPLVPSNVTSITRVVPPQDLGITDEFGDLVEDAPPEVSQVDVYESVEDREWRVHATKKEKKLYKFLNTKKRIEGVHILDLCEHMNMGPSRVNEILSLIQSRGKYIIISDDGQTVSASRLPEREGQTLTIDPDSLIIRKNKRGKPSFKILVIGDTHLSSKAQQITYLGETIRVCELMDDISFNLHLGDLNDGNGCYPGHANEIFLASPDDQLAYALAAFPQSDRQGFIISGNHDETHVQKRGTHVVERFCEERDDWTFLGDYNARLRLGEVEIMLYHGKNGITKNPWGKMSDVIAATDQSNLPDILLCGHWHVRGYFGFRGTEIYAVSAFQGLTPYLGRMGIDPMVGYMVLEIEIDDSGRMTGQTPLFWRLNKPRKNDYPDPHTLGQSIGGYAQKSLGA